MTRGDQGARLVEVTLPAFSDLEAEPRIGAAVFERRLAALRSQMVSHGVDQVVVYADREHMANVSWLTGFDPRFEEAVAVVGSGGVPAVITGNESMAMVADAPIELRGVLCQSLSLPGQVSLKSEAEPIPTTLGDAFREAGIARTQRIGVVGWKPMSRDVTDGPRVSLAIPHFVVAALEGATDVPLVDLTPVVCGSTGLRTTNEAEQIAFAEHRATRASQHVWRAIEALRPGITEVELSTSMRLTGLPLSCHVMCTSGAFQVNGLQSPTDRVIDEGDRLSIAVGLWGGLTARAGRVTRIDHPETAESARSFAGPYWSAVAAWYEALHIGALAGDVVRDVLERLVPAGIRPLLNPGHFLHLDEWTNTPFAPGSTQRLRSGMVMQSDIIPVGRDPSDVANAEDGVALADESLREELRARFPEAWLRIEGRRRFMTDQLGLRLSEDVLPLSDRQAAMPAALLDPNVVFATAQA